MNIKETVTNILNKGVSEKRQGNYDKALTFYAQANELDPENIWTYYNPAKVQFIQENYADSILNYLKAAHLSIVNMKNHISDNSPDGMMHQWRLDELPGELKKVFEVIHPDAIFLILDVNTPNHLGRTLSMLNDEPKTKEIIDDMNEYRLGISGQGGMPSDQLDENLYVPSGNIYLADNMDWKAIEKRIMNPNLVY